MYAMCITTEEGKKEIYLTKENFVSDQNMDLCFLTPC